MTTSWLITLLFIFTIGLAAIIGGGIECSFAAGTDNKESPHKPRDTQADLNRWLDISFPPGMHDNSKFTIAHSISRSASKYKLDPYLILGIIFAESRGDCFAENGSCLGLMQVSNKWWGEQLKEAGIINTPGDYFAISPAIEAGCYVLAYYLKVSNGDLKTALKRYGGFTRTDTAQFKSYYKQVTYFM